MTLPARVRCGPLWLLWLALLLTPRIAAADLHVVADFDGDGEQDHAVLDRGASTIQVWLSDSRRTSVIPSSTRAPRLAARDLDGDRRAELVVIGPSSSLQVWALRRSGTFEIVRARSPGLPRARAARRIADDSLDAQEDGEPGLSSFAFSPQRHLAADTRIAWRVFTSTGALLPLRFPSTLGPRPPPATA